MSARLDLLRRRTRAIRQSIECRGINLGNDDLSRRYRLERPDRDRAALRSRDPVQQPHSGEAPGADLVTGEPVDRFRPKPSRLRCDFRFSQLPAVEQIALVLVGARPEFDERAKWTFLRPPNRASVQERHVAAKIIDERPQLPRSRKPCETGGKRREAAIPRQ